MIGDVNMGVVPALMLRKKVIIKKLLKSGAISEESAKTLQEAGVFNPNAFPRITERMVEQKILAKTKTGKYYLVN